MGASWPAETGSRRRNEKHEEGKGLRVCLSFWDGGGMLHFRGFFWYSNRCIFNSLRCSSLAQSSSFWSPVSKRDDRRHVFLLLHVVKRQTVAWPAHAALGRRQRGSCIIHSFSFPPPSPPHCSHWPTPAAVGLCKKFVHSGLFQ